MQAKTILHPNLKPYLIIGHDEPNTHCRSLLLPCSTGTLQIILCWAALSDHAPLKALGKNFTQDIIRSLIQHFMINPGFNQVNPKWVSQDQWQSLIPDLLRKTVHKIQTVMQEQNWQDQFIHMGVLLCHSHGQELWWAGQGRISGSEIDQKLDAYPHLTALNTAQPWFLTRLNLIAEKVNILPANEATQHPMNPDSLTYDFCLQPVASKASAV